MLNINTDKMSEVIREAFDKAAGQKRWQNAIARAKVEIENNVFMAWQNDSLLILSASNEIYEANGTCQCKAYLKGQPCWHRAAARLVRRYNETAH
jgi:hypothetical protein